MERIVAAAMRGRRHWYEGRTHDQALELAVAAGESRRALVRHLNINTPCRVGFKTSLGRYVDREEAQRVAVACDQLRTRAAWENRELVAEDYRTPPHPIIPDRRD